MYDARPSGRARVTGDGSQCAQLPESAELRQTISTLRIAYGVGRAEAAAMT
jgi:hypothetical protein